MRKAFLIVALLMGISATSSAQGVKKVGNQYTITAKARTTESHRDSTGCTIKDTDGKVYPLFLSRNGRAYIIRTSKNTGKEYRKYLGEEISRQVCKDLGKEYKETK